MLVKGAMGKKKWLVVLVLVVVVVVGGEPHFPIANEATHPYPLLD